MRTLTVLLLVAFFAGCTSNTSNDITGKWFMYQVLQSGQDVTAEHNPNNERYLILKKDSTFETGGRPFGANTGKYAFDREKKTLFLDSDAGPDDDSYWKVSVKGDTMHWQGYGSEWADHFELIHVRAKS